MIPGMPTSQPKTSKATHTPPAAPMVIQGTAQSSAKVAHFPKRVTAKRSIPNKVPTTITSAMDTSRIKITTPNHTGK
ncbi:unannotated protein [freshwater metagenome]|uniref:Unannotated protein n=1 Tax=freshwater metagenome TaxID=449393 RepID=A0A6J6DTK0_9ZZZZ